MLTAKISLGNLLTILAVLGSIVSSTVVIVHNIDGLSERVAIVETRVTMIEHVQQLKKVLEQ